MTATMTAVRLHGVKDVRVDEVPVPEPGAGEVRVRVHACGVCGSDVHLVDGVTPTSPPPVTLGHEAAGVVDLAGPGGNDWAAGDRVAIAAGYGCGTCVACSRGAVNICPALVIPGISADGAQAAYVVVPARALVALPEPVDFATGAILTDAVATPFHAIRKAGVQRGDTVAVFGVGGLGLHAVALLHQLFAAHVIAVDVLPTALERAQQFGAADVVDVAVTSGGKAARALRSMVGGVDHAFEFVGAAAVTDQAVKALRPGGTCTVVGITPEPLALLPQALLVSAELRVQGSFGCTRDELVELVGHVAAGRLDVTGTITHRFPLVQTADAIRTLAEKIGDPIRVVVEQP